MESKICIECKVEFFRKIQERNNKWENRKYCSHKCYWKNLSTKRTPNMFQKWHKLVWTEHLRKWRENGGTPWNKWTYWYEIHWGSKSPLRKAIRSSQKNINWRTQILKRDNYTCLDCWRKRKPWDRVILEVDHIIPFAKILKDNKIESLESAYSIELLWDISNWRTLCKECHIKTESHWSNQWTL